MEELKDFTHKCNVLVADIEAVAEANPWVVVACINKEGLVSTKVTIAAI